MTSTSGNGLVRPLEAAAEQAGVQSAQEPDDGDLPRGSGRARDRRHLRSTERHVDIRAARQSSSAPAARPAT